MMKTTVLVVLLFVVNILQVCHSSEEQNSKLVQIDSGRVREYYKPIAQEDCLVANIFTPNTNEANLPVLVNIHGGAYTAGYGNSELPYSLVKEGNVVAVTFNYRLGILGFLCLGTEDVPGNAGLKDMVALLRWVKANIRSFGGNPDDVTIAGCSAGSSAVELLALSEATKGLFNKVISQSGAGVGGWSVQQNPIEIAQTLAKRMNFNNINDLTALEYFFKNQTIDSLTNFSFVDSKDSSLQFVPCLERELESESVLKTAPFDVLKQGTFEKYPTLTGFSNMEGLYRIMFYDEWIDNMMEDMSDYLPEDLKFETPNEKQAVADAAKELYFTKLNTDKKQGYIDYFTDVMFAYGVHRAVTLQVEAGNENMYFLEYSFVEKPEDSTTEPPGAGHCDQSAIVRERPGEESHSSDYYLLKKSMVQLWLNFIKTGKPVPSITEEFPEGWPAASVNGTYMEINLPSQLRRGWQPERAGFWDAVYRAHYSAPAPPNSASGLGPYWAATVLASLAMLRTLISRF
ncbi:unnamed protein product [Plutella xylostella]|uniref:Carboxylic ester hydrolase n=1 Tax=Plutella xylostella TaxID=51655 RepID=A0A8S4EEB4_PLUXY|nr:unnamed protein product [Plutella xylostella]